MEESAAALEAVQKALVYYENKTDTGKLAERLSRATVICRPSSFDPFNGWNSLRHMLIR
jgi:hypothetical protein